MATKYTVEMFGKEYTVDEQQFTGASGVVATVETFEIAFDHALRSAKEDSITKIHRFTQRAHETDGWVFEADGAELLKLRQSKVIVSK